MEETFAEYILNEKDWVRKLEIMFYLTFFRCIVFQFVMVYNSFKLTTSLVFRNSLTPKEVKS